MKQLFLILIAFVYIGCNPADKTLKTGDLIFQNIDCGPLCEAINAVTIGFEGKKFNHMGMVVKKNDSLFIIEAAGDAVRMISLEDFSKNTSTPMYLGRLSSKYQYLIPDAVAFATTKIGTPYDDAYIYGNGNYYCSELIYDAFAFAYKKPFFELQPMTFKKPETNTFFPAWVDHYEALGIPIPEGEPGCNPAGISLSDKIDILGVLNE